MLKTLQPAPELIGGPWFTDKELDTEFIRLISDFCLRVVKSRVRKARLDYSHHCKLIEH